VHREVLAEVVISAPEPDEDSDPAVAVDVARELLAGTRDESREPADRDVLSELRDEVRNAVGDRLGRPVGSRKLADRPGVARARLAECGVRRHLLGERLRERAEVRGARDEVRLAVHLDQDGGLGGDPRDHESFGGGAVRLARGRREPLLAEDLLGLLEVAGGFDERPLAIHHSHARFGAQIGYEFRSDFHGYLRSCQLSALSHQRS
jgi:hypothetical protein